MNERKRPGLFHGLIAAFVLALVWFAIAIAPAALLTGCANLPADPATRAAAVSNAVDTATLLLDAAWEHWLKHHPQDDPATAEAAAADPASAEAAATVAGPVLDFRWGGFRGGGAAEDPATQIRDFRMDKNGMRYVWAKGDLSNWGLARESAGALICAFYFDEKEQRWIGGKFDWISTSRLTRSWENVYAGYNGWKADPFFSAARRAICICTANGRRRTNLLEESK